MSFKFEEGESAALTQNRQYLSRIDRRIKGLAMTLELGATQLTQAEHDTEIKRLKAAQEDVKSRLSEAELKDYETAGAAATEEEEKAARDAVQKAMEANRDKPSI